jgi:hypothetical protein
VVPAAAAVADAAATTAADAVAAAAVATNLTSKLQLDSWIGQFAQADWPFPFARVTGQITCSIAGFCVD